MFHPATLLLIISTLTIIANGEEIKTKSSDLAHRIEELASQIAENAFNQRRGLSTNTLSNDDKQTILDLHNQLRRVTAKGLAPSVNGFHSEISDMNELIWDTALESFASDHTSDCSGQHSPYNADMSQYSPAFVPWNHDDNSWWQGENLWYSGASSVTLETIKSAIQAWFNENSNYIAGPYSSADYCKPGTQCGHFTQIVWAKTRYIGCAFHECPGGLEANPSQKVWFSCNYWPGGNYEKSWPYTPGTPCSHCDGDREVCNDGLCSGGLGSSFSVDGNTNVDICTNGLGLAVSNSCDGNSGNLPFVPIVTPSPTVATATLPATPSGNTCNSRGSQCLNMNDCCSGRCNIAKYRCN